VRVLLALFMDGVLFGSVTLFSSRHEGKWCIYLTHWTLVAVCAHLTLSVAGSLAARRSLARGEEPPRRPLWLPVLWSAQAIALPGSLLVFVLFWYATHRATRVPNSFLTCARAWPVVRCTPQGRWCTRDSLMLQTSPSTISCMAPTSVRWRSMRH
jgi:hypothetical protein